MFNTFFLSFLLNFFLLNCVKIIFGSVYQISYITLFYLNNQIVNLIILASIISLNCQWVKILYIAIPVGYYLKYLQTYSLVVKIAWVDALLVGLNTTHPYIYYLGFLSLVVYITKPYMTYSNYFLVHILQILLCALILGMYWGCSANLWGFFWVDDYIELILLGFCIFTTYNLHTYSNNSYINLILITLSCVLLITIRSGIVVTRHSFFINFSVTSYPVYLGYGLWFFLIAKFNSIVLVYGLIVSTLKYLIVILYVKVLVVLEKFIQKKINILIHIVILIGLLIWLVLVSNYFSYSYYKFYLNHQIVEYYNTWVLNTTEFILLYKTNMQMEDSILYYPLITMYLVLKFKKIMYIILLYGITFIYLIVALISTKKIYDN